MHRNQKAVIDAAHAGANLLDSLFPSWFEFINTDDLDIDDDSLCIFGQLAELTDYYYWDTPTTLPEDVKFGFVSAVWDSDALNEAWVDEIEERMENSQ